MNKKGIIAVAIFWLVVIAIFSCMVFSNTVFSIIMSVFGIYFISWIVYDVFKD